jgi:hypothetical protein
MVRKYWQRHALLWMAAVLLVGGGGIWVRDASAAAHPGDKYHDISFNGGPIIHAKTSGGINIDIGQPTTTSDGRRLIPLTVVDLYSSGFIEGIGDINIRLDAARTAAAGPSSLTANQKDADFPATQSMVFYPIFTVNGEDFNADQPAQVVNASVEVFPPKPGTTYVLINKMTLRSEDGNTLELFPGKKFVVGE